MVDGRIPGSTRRRLLVSISVALAGFGLLLRGRKPHGGSLPSEAKDISPPIPVRPGPWVYLTPYEAAAVEVIVAAQSSQLPHVPFTEHRIELWLSDEHDLQQLVRTSFEI